MTDGRRALAISTLGAGVAYANLAVALPLVVLADGGSASAAGALIAANTLAFSAGALLAPVFSVPERCMPAGLAAIAVGAALCAAAGGGPAPLAAGAVVHGVGMGLFWVGVQASLGRRAGNPGSQSTFVGQYALYVAGTAAGGATTGAIVAIVHAVGAGDVASVRVSFLVGAVAAAATLAPTISWARSAAPVPRPAGARAVRALWRDLGLQIPALMLVSAMGMLLSLTPIVLRDDFRLRPIVIGLVAGMVAAAKAGGSVTAGRFATARGSRRAVSAMLAGSALAAGLLVGADRAWLFVALVVAATFFGIGVWPVVVDGALARVSPEARRELSVAWNVREYAAIAATTAFGGYLLDVSGRPTLLLVLAATLLACAAVSALAVLRRPVYAPATT